MTDPTQRFSGRAENYARYRPGYPRAMLGLLEAECGLTPAYVVADVGSGTGLLARLFLENGNRVLGIEPNDEMRAAGERFLQVFPAFTSVAARAEATTLPGGSVDLVTVGQALDWFDPELSRREFVRILKPGGWLVVAWNIPRLTDTPFMAAHRRFWRACISGEPPLDREEFDCRVRRFYAPDSCERAILPNDQRENLAALQGGMLSASMAPQEGEPGYEAATEALARLFDDHQVDGHVTVENDTWVYYGRLTGKSV
jgi:SAM-dependent methyltransferase